MAAQKTPHFIVIDDDPFNNMLCEMLITSKAIISYATIQTFTMPEEALKHIQDNYVKPEAGLTIVFLDINMPSMTGWEFLKHFEKFDARIKECFKIYILSSSVDKRDEERARPNKNLVDYIVKPLTKEMVNRIVSQYYL
jgi:two-component SAPR family response regulator